MFLAIDLIQLTYLLGTIPYSMTWGLACSLSPNTGDWTELRLFYTRSESSSASQRHDCALRIRRCKY